MDEIIRIGLTVSGSLSVIVAGVYAALRLLRQDKQWEKLLAAKEVENKALCEENRRLRRLLKGKDEDDYNSDREEEDENTTGVDQPS